MNVLLITVDCLRYDKVGCLGGRKDLTPNIDRFARQATVLTQAVAQGPNTGNSFPSILSSTYSRLQDRGWRSKPVLAERPTLAALLSEQGFATGGFHSNPWLSAPFGYGQEYDVYEDNILPSAIRSRSTTALHLSRALKVVSPYLPGDKVTEQALDWIKEQHGSYFAWIHYMDAHSPYRVGGRLPAWLGHLMSWRLYHKARTRPEMITESEHQKLLNRHEEGIRFVDRVWGAAQRELEASGHLADTLVIITADHGETFGEHGRYGHGGQFYDELLRVPLILRWPGQETVPRVDGQVELSTILPTVLDVLGLPIPDHVVGRSAVPWLRGEVAPTEHINAEAISSSGISEDYAVVSVRTQEWKYILRRSAAGDVHHSELFHLTTDPGEQDECGQRHPDVVARMNQQAEAHVQRVLDSDEPEGEEIELPEQVVARLRALGYMD